jgi:glutathione-regulated potassium-efflux system ancillary protein KefG
MGIAAAELDELIDAGEVADILGLAHRNSVSTYRTRYADFPPGRPAPGGGRGRLWTRREIVDWHHAFRARIVEASGQPSARRSDLVDATLRLLMAHPGEEISIRQIAAEAGVAHSDLYRYADSKDQLIDLAILRLEESMATSLPTDFDALLSSADQLLDLIRRAAPGMRVLTDRALQGKLGSPNAPLPVSMIASMIPPSPEGTGPALDPRVKAACAASVLWGLIVLENRWREALDLDEIPADQVGAIVRAVLTA